MSEERLLAFCRALSDSVSSGLPLAETLRSLSRVSFQDRKLAAAADLVGQGKTLHESLSAQGLHPPILIALIRAGEESGKVDKFLDRFSAALESRIDFHRRLKRALVYPAFAAGVAGAIFLLFSTKAAPLLLQPILDAGGALPPAALQMIAAGDILLANWSLLLGAILAFVIVMSSIAGSSPGRKARALAGHWLPGVRFAAEEARSYQFAATLELLLAAGLRPPQIIEILLEYFRDDPITRRRLRRGATMLADGKSFSESVASCLPADDRPRLAVAETAGRLDEALGKLAVGHRDRHLHRLKLTATVVQLTSIVALAPLCFGLILWILWPTMAMLRQAVTSPGGLLPEGAPTYQLETAPAVPPASAAASRFNELHAPAVVGFMRDHAVEKDAGAEDGAKAPAEPKKKKMVTPKLQDRSMNRLPRRTIEPTRIQSSLE